MEKDLYYKDYLVSRIISQGKQVAGYDCVYFQTNENLVDIYRTIPFTGKNVLSVLASGDQLFTSNYLGANEVDTFDMNRLTIYYYFLRKWSIKYMNSLYPNITNKKWMNTLLKCVKPETPLEQKALEFYTQHLKENTNFTKLYYDVDIQPEGKTLYHQAEELQSIIDQPFSFQEFNLFAPTTITKKYDIIIISNILDWARSDEQKLQVAKRNLDTLLKTGGTVICTCLINRYQDKEFALFKPDYEYQDFGKQIGYTYTKKK